MNKIIIGVIVLVLVSIGAWLALRPQAPVPVPGGGESTTTTTPVESAYATYTDPEGVFTFEYPKAWSVFGRNGSELATVSVPRSYIPNTNFDDAKLTVNWSNASSSMKTCSGTATTSEAAAGNRYDTTTTKKVYDGDCYVLAYTIHYGNIQNYDPNQGVTEFDEAKLKGELDRVVQSFRYLVNSD